MAIKIKHGGGIGAAALAAYEGGKGKARVPLTQQAMATAASQQESSKGRKHATKAATEAREFQSSEALAGRQFAAERDAAAQLAQSARDEEGRKFIIDRDEARNAAQGERDVQGQRWERDRLDYLDNQYTERQKQQFAREEEAFEAAMESGDWTPDEQAVARRQRAEQRAGIKMQPRLTNPSESPQAIFDRSVIKGPDGTLLGQKSDGTYYPIPTQQEQKRDRPDLPEVRAADFAKAYSDALQGEQYRVGPEGTVDDERVRMAAATRLNEMRAFQEKVAVEGAVRRIDIEQIAELPPEDRDAAIRDEARHFGVRFDQLKAEVDGEIRGLLNDGPLGAPAVAREPSAGLVQTAREAAAAARAAAARSKEVSDAARRATIEEAARLHGMTVEDAERILKEMGAL